MELTTGIIFSRLSEDFRWEHPGEWKNNRVGVVYFEDGQEYEAGGMYILEDGGRLDRCLESGVPAVFLVPGKAAPCPEGCPAEIVYYADASDGRRILNAVNAVLREFNDWESELYRCPCTAEGVQQLLALGRRYLSGRMSLSDIYLNYIMFNAGLRKTDAGKTVSRAEKITDEGEISDLIDDPEFHRYEKETGVFFYSSMDYATLCYNLFRNGRFCYRLIYNNFKNTYSDEEYYLFEYIGNHARDLVACIPSMTAPIPANTPVRNSIYILLNGGGLPERLLREQLSAIGWSADDRYYLIRMKYYFVNSEYDAPLHHSLQLEHKYPESIALKYQGGLILLLNISRNTGLGEYGFLHDFSVFIRESMYKCGISAVTQGFTNLCYALEQANFALDYGLAHQDMFWYFKFEDYYLEYMKEQTTRILPPDFICHPGICRLREYDEQNETMFYQTLFIYLQYAHNLNEAARVLHVHRTTFLYRIKKIEEIAGVELRDWRVKLHLMMSYLILGGTKGSE